MRAFVAAACLSIGCGFSGSEPTGTPGSDAGSLVDGAPGADVVVADAAAADGDVRLSVVYRINIGGGQYEGVDNPGTWTADNNECSGTVSNSSGPSVNGTVDDDLYMNYRFESVMCDLAVVPGAYRVRFLLGEVYRNGGNCIGDQTSRPILLELEGTQVDAFDLVAESGGCVADPNDNDALPFVREFDIVVTDGTLNAGALPDGTNSMLGAIEVLELPGMDAP